MGVRHTRRHREMSDENWHLMLERTHKAIRDFARVEFEALTRKVIHRLQRIDASGIFGDEYVYKTLWNEYCHEVQEGPHEPLESAWDLTITAVLDDIVERAPSHTRVLLSLFAAWELDEDDPSFAGST